MSTRADNECKGCTASVHVNETQLAAMEKEAVFSTEGMSTAELYKERLATCRTCDGFVYGTTCKYCGCLIPLKAKVVSATCPYPFESKWLR